MRISVKTLRGNQFDIDVKSSDSVRAVKMKIESAQGKDTFPCAQQMLIFRGKVLKDDTTLQENSVGDLNVLVVMLTKVYQVASTTLPPASAPSPAIPASPATTALPTISMSVIVSEEEFARNENDFGQAASSFLAGDSLEHVVESILEMGGGSWDKQKVLTALQATNNNPDRAVDYLYNGSAELAEDPVATLWAQPTGTEAPTDTTEQDPVPVFGPSSGAHAQAARGGPNTEPLHLFPQGMSSLGLTAPRVVDFFKNHPQFEYLRHMVQNNPRSLQPLLQEIGKHDPFLFEVINDNLTQFVQLINEETSEDSEEDILEEAGEEMPQLSDFSPEEREAIERLEALGFDQVRVIEAFLACDRNELQAASYLVEDESDSE
ncbi:hypothetical protein KP509_38G063200 [Ceratopteris richardii]|uniref:Ubiquitin receptor RAD23 n=1 Tax=Ceratopteris richardii TaxID=49495 RepID=A0A8T2Q5G7_CERRI|nr:hypothetical protein KP509_38G063200 [Ceratopteris richardii]